MISGPAAPVRVLFQALRRKPRGCSSVVEHLLAKERVESSNLFIRLIASSSSSLQYLKIFCSFFYGAF